MYSGYEFWWLLAMVPAGVVAVSALLGWLWHPVLVGWTSNGCESDPADFVRITAFMGGAAAIVGGAFRAIRRRPRMPGAVIMSMGLLLVAAGLFVNYVLAVNDLGRIDVCLD